MQKKYKNHWAKINDALPQLKTQIVKNIFADKIVSNEDLNTFIQAKFQTILNEETTCIKSISAIELNDDFKNRLIDQLREKAKKAAKYLRTDIWNEYLKYQAYSKKENCQLRHHYVEETLFEDNFTDGIRN